MVSVDKLRDEITALQASLRDLLKWKLVLTGSVTAVGLGLTGSAAPNAYLSIGAIPLIVAYCDLLARDYDLRIGIITTYLSTEPDSIYAKYENFLRLHEITRIRWWDLGEIAIQISSYIACIFVLCVGVAHTHFNTDSTDISWVFLIVISLAGIISVSWIQRKYDRKYDALWEISKTGSIVSLSLEHLNSK